MLGELGVMLMLGLGGAHGSARPTAQRYLDAIADGDEHEICHLLSPWGRRHLREDSMKRTCLAAAREFPRELGRFPIVKIEFEGQIAWVTIGDHEISDGGDDVFRMSHATGHWLVLDA